MIAHILVVNVSRQSTFTAYLALGVIPFLLRFLLAHINNFKRSHKKAI